MPTNPGSRTLGYPALYAHFVILCSRLSDHLGQYVLQVEGLSLAQALSVSCAIKADDMYVITRFQAEHDK
jgi:hypothetical protein